MSLDTVRAYFATLGREDELLVTPGSSHTVAEAAAAFGVEPARIAKTLAYTGETDDTCELIVMAGDARSDNALFKARFGRKASMLKPEVVLELTGHRVGGVCPFANPPGSPCGWTPHCNASTPCSRRPAVPTPRSSSRCPTWSTCRTPPDG